MTDITVVEEVILGPIDVIEEIILGPIDVIEEVILGPIDVVKEIIYEGVPGGGGSIETITSGAVFRVHYDLSGWPDRPTTRTDVMILWVGPDPSPPIVVPPSVAGMYDGDARFVNN